MSPEIVLQNSRTYSELDGPKIRRWLLSVLGVVAPEATSLGVRFNGLRAMGKLNQRFRAKDGATDVLSFPGDRVGGHFGDIVICVPRAREQAAQRRHSLEREVRLLLLHGLLHCSGHDHEVDDGEMESLERGLRRRWLGPR